MAQANDLKILAASQNWEGLIQAPAASMLGLSLHDYLDFEGNSARHEEVCEWIHSGKSKVKIKTPPGSTESPLYGTCYGVGTQLVLEFEFPTPSAQADSASILQNLVHRLKDSTSIEDVSQHAAETLKDLSGIDRVMIYRFDREWNGEVIAEAKEPGLETFLHLKYPAYDIPAQARQLFFQNRSRMITSIDAEAVPIVTAGFHPADIDLSLSILRAVSPIHIQYLVNMGVTASFSAPIKVGNRLWGLIASHHYSGPKHVSPDARAGFELASQIISGKIGDLITNNRLQIKNNTLILTQNLLSNIAAGKGVIDCFKSNEESLLGLTKSHSAYIRIGGQEVTLGKPIPAEILNAVLRHTETLSIMSPWKSNCLSKTLDLPSDSHFSGALAVPFSLGFEDTLIWFRAEEVSEVRWAGKPQDKQSPHTQTLERLSPRSSFAEWREKLEDHSRDWTDSDEDVAQYLLFGFVQGIFSKAQALSTAYQELELISNAKDEFIGTVSHELRTPLSAILGWLDILKEYPQPYAEAAEAIEVIERNANIQISLINDLLDMSRIISGKMRLSRQPNIDIHNLITGVVSSLRPTAEAKNITLSFESSSQQTIIADPDRIRQIVWNLITNAVKFTPRGGKVKVSVGHESSACSIAVEDDGIGMDPSKINSLFGRFVQAKTTAANLGGLGLGLSIVKSLVELHGGMIEGFSEGEGHGSKFVLSLPVYALASDQSELETFKPLDHAKSSRLNGIRVLIAEDQPDSRRALRILIERNGGMATDVGNGIEGLERLKSQAFDLILSDVGMPDMDGFTFIRTWRQEEKKRNSPEIPAIALTAYASSKDRTQALQAGFQNHIPKPVDKAELLAVIDTLNIKSPLQKK